MALTKKENPQKAEVHMVKMKLSPYQTQARYEMDFGGVGIG